MFAYCYASGLIEFGPRIPKGTMKIAEGPAKVLRKFIEVRARHGYRTRKVKGRPTKIKGTDHLLVPGIPEHKITGKPPIDSLRSFNGWLAQYPPKGVKIIGIQ